MAKRERSAAVGAAAQLRNAWSILQRLKQLMLCKFLSVFLQPIADDDDDDCGDKDNDVAGDDDDDDEEWRVKKCGVWLVLPGLKLIKRQSNFDNLQVEEKKLFEQKVYDPFPPPPPLRVCTCRGGKM